jgi:hypothetical protein
MTNNNIMLAFTHPFDGVLLTFLHTHVPRRKDRVFVKGEEYVVTKVVWDYSDNIVFIHVEEEKV